MKINKEGYNTIIVGAVLSAVLSAALFLLLRWAGLANLAIGIAVAAFTVVLGLIVRFFRDPERPHIIDEELVFSPADGKVVIIEEVYEKEYLARRCIQVSVFMSMSNVHVNRYPVSGKIIYIKYHPGAHAVAWYPKSSEKNEHMTTAVETPRGVVLFRQIAGFVARRIVNYARQGEQVEQNTRCGMIKLGSRVDIFLPLDTQLLVDIGSVVRGAVTPLAKLPVPKQASETVKNNE